MSMDVKIYVIDDLDIELDGFYDSNSLKDSYIFYPISYGHPFEVLEKYGKKVMIRYHYTNFVKYRWNLTKMLSIKVFIQIFIL